MPTSEIQPPVHELLLLQVIRDVTNQIGDNLPFGHGLRSYANLQTRKGIFETEKKFPRAYLYPVQVTDEFVQMTGLEQSYECLMDFLTVCKMSDKPEVLEAHLRDMFHLVSNFLWQLHKHPEVKSIVDIVREPNYHVFDSNLCGWNLRFTIKLHDYYCA